VDAIYAHVHDRLRATSERYFFPNIEVGLLATRL
jgi:hypothetical protein